MSLNEAFKPGDLAQISRPMDVAAETAASIMSIEALSGLNNFNRINDTSSYSSNPGVNDMLGGFSISLGDGPTASPFMQPGQMMGANPASEASLFGLPPSPVIDNGQNPAGFDSSLFPPTMPFDNASGLPSYDAGLMGQPGVPGADGSMPGQPAGPGYEANLSGQAGLPGDNSGALPGTDSGAMAQSAIGNVMGGMAGLASGFAGQDDSSDDSASDSSSDDSGYSPSPFSAPSAPDSSDYSGSSSDTTSSPSANVVLPSWAGAPDVAPMPQTAQDMAFDFNYGKAIAALANGDSSVQLPKAADQNQQQYALFENKVVATALGRTH